VAALEAGADLAIASRIMEESRFELRTSTIPYVHSRHRLSRLFNALVRFTLLPGLLDTQAGFKGFTAAAAEALFAELRCKSFAFDLEILARARRLGLSVVELPVTFRYREDPSTVKLLRHGALLVRDLARLSLLFRLGRSM
jgi:dolichyl-phosphate beta-glucosyltransferase